MQSSFSRSIRAVVFSVASLLVFCGDAQAQQHKGDKEILFFTGGFFIATDEHGFTGPSFTGTGTDITFSGVRNLNLGVKLGYFVTQRNEIGGGTNLFVSHSKVCVRTFVDSQFAGESCRGNTDFSLGLGVFYRYHFAREGAKRFFFVGSDLSAADLTSNFTGNIKVRPHAGYRYFLEKKVAIDFSLGYSAEVNKVDRRFAFPVERQGAIDGQLSLSFVF